MARRHAHKPRRTVQREQPGRLYTYAAASDNKDLGTIADNANILTGDWIKPPLPAAMPNVAISAHSGSANQGNVASCLPNAAPVGKKCRAEFAIVEAIFSADGSELEQGLSVRSPSFGYEKGSTVHPDHYDDDICTECTNGIHFFMEREEAENYMI